MLSNNTLDIFCHSLMTASSNLTMTNNTFICFILISLTHCGFWNSTFFVINSLSYFRSINKLSIFSLFKSFNILLLSIITVFNRHLIFSVFNTFKVLLHEEIILCCIFNSWLKVFHMLNWTFDISTNHTIHATMCW
jgi:hypothetical protein